MLSDKRFIVTDQHGQIMHAPSDLPWVGKTLDQLRAEQRDLELTPISLPAKP
jgi:hypothetical protein